MSIKKASKKRSFWDTSVGETILDILLYIGITAVVIGCVFGATGLIYITFGQLAKLNPSWESDIVMVVSICIVAGIIVGIVAIYYAIIGVKYIIATIRTLNIPLTKEEIKEYGFDSILDYANFIKGEARYRKGRYVEIFKSNKSVNQFVIDTLNIYIKEVMASHNIICKYLSTLSFMNIFPSITISDTLAKNLFTKIKDIFFDIDKINFYNFNTLSMSKDTHKLYCNSLCFFINKTIPLGFIYDDTRLAIFYNKSEIDDVFSETFEFNGEEMNDEFLNKCLDRLIRDKF